MVKQNTLSINIKRDKNLNLDYIISPNTNQVYKHIVDSFKTGIHSFNIIGSYGTGKSAFLWALEQHLSGAKIFDSRISFGNYKGSEYISLVGEYESIIDSFSEKLGVKAKDKSKQIFVALNELVLKAEKNKRILVVSIDEFGKYLEYASKHNPEQEIYFIQQLAEFVNDTTKNVIFLTTLHQDFSGYALGLNKQQRNEWEKVKGRFKEVTFNEPVEQLLLLVSKKLKQSSHLHDVKNFEKLFKTIGEAKVYPLRDYFSMPFAKSLLPFDILTAATLTLTLQRYGQNERSVFSFINSSDPYGLNDFDSSKSPYYNLANLYDYLHHNFYSFLNVKFNPHYPQWSSMRIAIEHAESKFGAKCYAHVAIIKTIGLLNIFANGSARLDKEFLLNYGKFALGYSNMAEVVKDLQSNKIVRFKNFNQRFVLADGTDVDIELAIDEAGKLIETVSDVAYQLKQYFDFPYVSARAISIKKGTPRFFQFHISSTPEMLVPIEETDGYISLIFSEKIKSKDILKFSAQTKEAVLYGLFNNTSEISYILNEINKTKKAIEIHVDDKIAVREFQAIFQHYVNQLNHAVLDGIYSNKNVVTWFSGGKEVQISGRKNFNERLSKICEAVYPKTPTYRNELINRTKYSSQILVSRRNIIKRLLRNTSQPDLGFSVSEFPPEKTIYLTLIKNTGIHSLEEGELTLKGPDNLGVIDLWNEGVNFLEKAKSGKLNIQELVDVYNRPPYKLKRGFIDFWLAIFLIINKDEFALFTDSSYIPELTEDSLELIVKCPGDFYIKTFNLSGVRLELFNLYRKMMSQKSKAAPKSFNFIETIRPFLNFYSKEINLYARHTNNIPLKAQQFRKAISLATDPEKSFFEDFPNAFGYTTDDLQNNVENLESYINDIKESIKAIRLSYENLLNRFEAYIGEKIAGTFLNFDDMRETLQNRFQNVKDHLLSASQKVFFERVILNNTTRNAYLNSLAQASIGKPLENFNDKDEAILYDKFNNILRELDNVSELTAHNFDANKEDLFKLEVTHLFNDMQQQVIRLPKAKTKDIKDRSLKIGDLLTDDKQINISILTSLLIEQMK